MQNINRLYYALNHIENKSVATMGFGDWSRLVRTDGQITELEQLPIAISNAALQASTLVAIASGIAVPNPGMDILRLDPIDAPYVINLDHYTVIENLHLHDIYPETLKIAGYTDTAELHWALQNQIYIIKEPPNDHHWMTDFPDFVLQARRKTGS